MGQSADEPASKPGQASPVPPGGVQEYKPPLFLLRDKDGNLQPVSGFTFEEFRELYELKHRLQEKSESPGHSIQRMVVSGKVAEEHVEMDVELRVLARHGKTRVPLRLEQAVLRSEDYEGPGKHLLHLDAETGGYVLWLDGEPEALHKLTLHVLVPLRRIGEEARLRLRTPQATISEMKLTVPMKDVEATAVEPATLVSTAPVGKDSSEIRALGVGGDLEMVWRPSGAPKPATPVIFEAESEATVRLEGPRVTTRLAIRLHDARSPLDEVVVCLPEGAQIQSTPQTGFTLEETEPGKVRLAFPAKASEQRAEITFVRDCDPEKPDAWVELGGFEVAGATRHRGHVAVAALGDWHMEWESSPSVRRTDNLPEGLRVEGLVAGFRFLGQPFSLKSRPTPKKTRVSVEPEYRLFVGATEARLEARLVYTIRGAKVSRLGLTAPGWEVEDIDPDNPVLADLLPSAESGQVRIPLKQPTIGRIEIALRARQPIPPGASALSLSLPRAFEVESSGRPSVVALPPSVVVLPEDNVELLPDEEAMAGLTRQPLPPQTQLPRRQQAPLAYRGDSRDAVFACGFQVHEREVHVQAAGQVRIERDSIQVEQKLGYTIAYEMLGALTVRVPRPVAEAEGLQFSVDGQAVPAAPLPTGGEAEEDPGPVLMSVVLPQPRIGPCNLSVRYRLAAERLEPNQSVLRTVYLVLPNDGELTAASLSVSAGEGIEAKPRDTLWTMTESGPDRAGQGRRLTLTATEPPEDEILVLAVHLEDTPGVGTTIVQRGLVQTWLGASARQDRAWYRLTTSRDALELMMPEGAALAEMQVTVDGSPIAFQVEPAGRVTVPMPSSGSPRSVVVELSYHFRAGRPARGTLDLDFPRLGRDVWVRRLYWQLVLPRNEHLMVSAPGFTREFRWGWNGLFFGRLPLWSQSELVAWVGGAADTGPDLKGVNCYVFSTMGSPPGAEVETVGRSLIVLIASLSALGLGLAVIYVRAFRHPVALLAVAVGLTAGAVLHPESAILLTQASAVGVVLSLLAVRLQRRLPGRRDTRLAGAPSAGLEQDSTQTQYLRPAIGSQGSTQVAPALAPASTGDGGG